jgi:hypothetical protein
MISFRLSASKLPKVVLITPGLYTHKNNGLANMSQKPSIRSCV